MIRWAMYGALWTALAVACQQNSQTSPSKKVILSDQAPQPIGPYSQAIERGGLLFVSGQIAIEPTSGAMDTTTIEAETKRVMENLSAVLSAGGYSFDHVLKCTIYMTDLSDFAKVNTVYGGYFSGNPPARETVQVAALPKGAHIEISVIAGK